MAIKSKVVFLALALASSAALHAQQLKGMGEFLDQIKSNPARGENAEFDFPAYIKDIEVITANDGSRFAGVELGNDNLNGVILTWGSTKLACALPVKEAAKLDKKQRVHVKGKVQDITSYQEYNQLTNGMIKRLIVTAICQISLPQEEIKPEPLKSTRVPEPGASASIPTATLCDTGEGTVFACNTGKKTVSVCSTAEGVNYRYGINRSTLDITVEGNSAKSGQYPLAGGEVWYYRFSNGNTNYVVYSAESSAIDKAGVVVEQGAKRIANLTCKNSPTINLDLAGPETDTEGFDLP